MTTKRTFLAPAGAVCGCCSQACAGEPVWRFTAVGNPDVYVHADERRCLRLAFDSWKQDATANAQIAGVRE